MVLVVLLLAGLSKGVVFWMAELKTTENQCIVWH